MFFGSQAIITSPAWLVDFKNKKTTWMDLKPLGLLLPLYLQNISLESLFGINFCKFSPCSAKQVSSKFEHAENHCVFGQLRGSWWSELGWLLLSENHCSYYVQIPDSWSCPMKPKRTARFFFTKVFHARKANGVDNPTLYTKSESVHFFKFKF